MAEEHYNEALQGNSNSAANQSVTTVLAQTGTPGEEVPISYTNWKLYGKGRFGMVYAAKLLQYGAETVEDRGEAIAIKKVLHPGHPMNRELRILQLVQHPNVVRLLAFFYSESEQDNEEYLKMVLEFMPETICSVLQNYSHLERRMPILEVKLYVYQLLRSLAYVHALGITHRDVNPENLLVDPDTGVLKLCDFGSATILRPGEPNHVYVSRYCRAPELLFGATNYTDAVDLWSVGCLMAEMMLARRLFPGESGIDQLVEIMKLLGSPTPSQIGSLNPNFAEHQFPLIRPRPLTQSFPLDTPADAIALISNLLKYTPSARLPAIEALAQPVFDDLRVKGAVLPNGTSMPALFDFSRKELSTRPDLIPSLVPDHAAMALKARGIDIGGFVPIPLAQILVSLTVVILSLTNLWTSFMTPLLLSSRSIRDGAVKFSPIDQ